MGLCTIAALPAGCGSSEGSAFGDAGAAGPNAGSVGGNPDGASANGGNPNGGGNIDFGGQSEGGAPGCTGLECQQKTCANGATTTLKGYVFDPSGLVPIYNALVYVPNAPIEPFKPGVSCDRCGTILSGSPIATAITDANGGFELKNAPAGANIPLVVQVGRWRRKISVTTVRECGETVVDSTLTRLPRNKSEGDLPHIAISTGGADSLECFLRKLGIDDKEFTLPTGNGAVHFYTGETGSVLGNSPKSQQLWGSVDTLKKYDMVILSCEGDEYNDTKPTAARAAMRDYLDAGGRVFASHYHYTWFENGAAPLPKTASWVPNTEDGDQTVSIDTSFAKGQAFADWMENVGASVNKGSFFATDLRQNVQSVPAKGEPAETSRRWVYWKNDDTELTKYFSFNTPIGSPPAQQCGRGVYTDIHVSGTPLDDEKFPDFCKESPFNTAMTPQEKALLFLLMDLASCIQDESKPPAPPPIIN